MLKKIIECKHGVLSVGTSMTRKIHCKNCLQEIDPFDVCLMVARGQSGQPNPHAAKVLDFPLKVKSDANR